MTALRSVAHKLTHVKALAQRVIILLGVGCSKVSWFGRGQRPRRRRAANELDELAPFQSIELHSNPHQPWPVCRISHWQEQSGDNRIHFTTC